MDATVMTWVQRAKNLACEITAQMFFIFLSCLYLNLIITYVTQKSIKAAACH